MALDRDATGNPLPCVAPVADSRLERKRAVLHSTGAKAKPVPTADTNWIQEKRRCFAEAFVVKKTKKSLPGILPATSGDSFCATLPWPQACCVARRLVIPYPARMRKLLLLCGALACICPSQTSACNSSKAEELRTTSLLCRVPERMGAPGPSLLCLCWTPNLCWDRRRACHAVSPPLLWRGSCSTGFLPGSTLDHLGLPSAGFPFSFFLL